MKKALVLAILCILTILLTSCVKPQDVSDDSLYELDITFEIKTDFFDSYKYQTISHTLSLADYRLQSMQVHEERIYMCVIRGNYEEQQTAVIINMAIDGSAKQQIEVQITPFAQIVGFNVNGDGNFALLITENNDKKTVLFYEYDHEGNELLYRDFSSFFQTNFQHREIEKATISNGKIAVYIRNSLEPEIYLLCVDNEQPTILKPNSTFHLLGGIVELNDDMLAFIDINKEDYFLREINLSGKVFGKTLPVAPRNTYFLFPTNNSSQYDVLMSDGIKLYGYNTDTNEQTVLLEWVETGISGVIYVGELADGRLSILTWDMKLYTLTPISREILDIRNTITIGGIYIPHELRLAVSRFNRTSDTYEIEILEYADEYATFEQWPGGFMRLQLDLMTGKGPDIIFDPVGWMTNHDLLRDLYPFIDVDPDLNRTDFFPNILTSFESVDESLSMIANSFNIQTMVGKTSTVGHIQAWTPSALLLLVEENSHLKNPLGMNINREVLIHKLLKYAGPDLIDWNNHTAYIDSEEFISLLKASALLPKPLTLEEILSMPSPADPELLMIQNEQILEYVLTFSPSSYNILSSVLEEVVVLGIPTFYGGVNLFEPTWKMGINASSAYPIGAWEFIRNFLLPTAEIDWWNFPLRIDLFEKQIEVLKTPNMGTDGNGNTVEIPFELELFGEGGHDSVVFDVYALTDDKADEIRKIVNTSVIGNQNVSFQALFDLVDGDIASFFSGMQSAEDTARIIQSRVQRFLDERQP